MSFTSIERSLCNKMVDEFDALISPAIQAKLDVMAYKSQFESELSGMVFSPPNVVQDEANTLKAAARNLYPGDELSDIESMKNLLDRCSYLSGLSPVSSILGTLLGIFSGITDLIDRSTIPEFGAASLGGLINDILNGANLGFPGGKNISSYLGWADKLIECLAGVCGDGDIDYIILASDYATSTEDLYESMNVISNPLDPNYGSFDYEAIYDDIGMTVQEKLNMGTALTAITDMKTGAVSAVTNSVNKIKELSKTGYF